MKLDYFKTTNFHTALQIFFENLNIPINYLADEPTSAREVLKDTWKDTPSFKLINDVYFLGMVDDAAFSGNKSINASEIKSDYDGILIFGVTLNKRENNRLPARSQLAEVTRAFNREFHYTPVVVVFRYGNYISLANAQRLKYKQEWREGEKAGKVSILRDVEIKSPHTGHLKILEELKITRSGKKGINSFEGLYQYWQDVLSVNLLNKKFYSELSNWYFWAIKHVTFPSESQYVDDKNQQYKAQNVIRLLTRLLFVWFIKEKKLIPEELFDLDDLQKNILKKISPFNEKDTLFKKENQESIYYKAILQNLFFATLNCPVKPDSIDSRERGFRGDESYGKHRGVDFLMRYKKYFKNPDAFLEMVNKVVPFLNGGLFECLDDKDKKIYIDGFSDNMSKTNGKVNNLIVPDYLFFGREEKTDLSSDYGKKNKGTKEAAVKGLINILKSYKFTIAENTPIEEDVALDPELLGKVFENLLASYNPETKTTARKQTGSFYTPREIVNYMVDESLIAYLKSTVSFQLTDNYLNPNDIILIKQGNLPHWTQDKVWYFITFRLADSIPQEKIKQLKQEREQWLQKHQKENYSKEELAEYYRLFSERVEEWMNAGYGKCVLNDGTNAKVITDALKYFEGKRYQLDEWVVMPNHVHVLVKPLEGHKLSDILHSWKSFTANKINKNIGKTGQLWMHESYDHIVRNEKAFHAIKTYIRQNPEMANIKVLEASSNVLEASSFKIISQSIPASGTISQSRDALDTMFHQLLSFDNINPFAENEGLQKQITHALDNCKILDPACGSGAFPMGILQKMVHILQKVDPKNKYWQELQLNKAVKATEGAFAITDKKEREQKLIEINDAFDEKINDPDYARKLFLVEDCIYGVDIQAIAAQISKLRFFISLIVDQKVDKDKPNFGIRALPNLETKFVAANTLIGIDKPKDQMAIFENQEVKELEKELKKVRHRLFSAKSPGTKRRLRDKDKEIREKMGDLLIENGWANETAKQLASWDPYDQNASSPFFDPEWMFGIKDGFDVVIGNPPYVQIQKFSGKQEQKNWEQQKFATFVKTGDIYCLFYERGNMLLRDNGVLVFITSNKWMRANYGKKTRKYFTEKTNPLVLINFGGYKIFESATVDTNILIFGKNKNRHSTNACAIGKDYSENISISDYMTQHSIKLDNLGEESWIISSKEEYAIKKRIEKIGIPLNNWDLSINYGIKTGFNEAFIIDGAKKDELIAADPKNAEIIKPILRGRDIKRYKVEFADLWLINTNNGYFDDKIQKRVPPIEIDDYPIMKKYLDQFLEKLEKRQDKGVTPYNLRNCAYIEEFEKEKIAWGNLALHSQFNLIQKGQYINAPSPFITSGSKYLLSVLNSSIGDHYIRLRGVTRNGGYFEYKPMFIEHLPIPQIPPKSQKPFEIIVDCILFAKKNNLESEASTLESVIDGMVYDLYFEDEMKKANCYITDRITGVVQPFKKNDTDDFKKEYIEKLVKFCNEDKTVFRGLIHRRTIEVVEIISGSKK